MIFICKTQFRETLEAYESPNAPRTVKTNSLNNVTQSRKYLNVALTEPHTHTQNSTP